MVGKSAPSLDSEGFQYDLAMGKCRVTWYVSVKLSSRSLSPNTFLAETSTQPDMRTLGFADNISMWIALTILEHCGLICIPAFEVYAIGLRNTQGCSD